MTTQHIEKGSQWTGVAGADVTVDEVVRGEGALNGNIVVYHWGNESYLHARTLKEFREDFKPAPIITEDVEITRGESSGLWHQIPTGFGVDAKITIHPDGTWTGERL